MKKLLISLLVLMGLCIHAQDVGNSPYAVFGIGDVKYDNTVEIAAMGGISTAYMSDFGNSFNFQNPAANKNLILTSIHLEGTNERNFFKSNYNNINSNRQSSFLSNISIAFPLSKKVKMGIGYQPYSSKSYSVIRSKTLSNNTVKANNFHGKGTISTLQTAVSYNISSEIGVGLRANYYFGNIQDIDEITYSDVELINGHEVTYNVKHFNLTLGTLYQKNFLDDKQFTIGATATLGKSGTINGKYINSTYYYTSRDKKNEDQESIIEEKTLKSNGLFPFESSLGVGYGENSRWFLGTQIDYKKGETVPFYGQDVTYKDAFKYSVGGWFIPDINNFRNYFSRVMYRYGAFYEKGNLYLNNHNVNKWGLSLGVTLPFKNRMSGLDFGIEFGQRGTVKSDLIRQNFINLKIGLNFADKWFRKRTYD